VILAIVLTKFQEASILRKEQNNFRSALRKARARIHEKAEQDSLRQSHERARRKHQSGEAHVRLVIMRRMKAIRDSLANVSATNFDPSPRIERWTSQGKGMDGNAHSSIYQVDYEKMLGRSSAGGVRTKQSLVRASHGAGGSSHESGDESDNSFDSGDLEHIDGDGAATCDGFSSDDELEPADVPILDSLPPEDEQTRVVREAEAMERLHMLESQAPANETVNISVASTASEGSNSEPRVKPKSQDACASLGMSTASQHGSGIALNHPNSGSKSDSFAKSVACKNDRSVSPISASEASVEDLQLPGSASQRSSIPTPEANDGESVLANKKSTQSKGHLALLSKYTEEEISRFMPHMVQAMLQPGMTSHSSMKASRHRSSSLSAPGGRAGNTNDPNVSFPAGSSASIAAPIAALKTPLDAKSSEFEDNAAGAANATV